jgi:hypothetical protein
MCGLLSVAACGSSKDKASDGSATQKTPDGQTGQATATPDSGKQTKPTKRRIPKCGPTPGSPTSLKDVRTLKSGQRFNVALSELRLGSGKAKVRVVGIFRDGRRLKNTFTGKGSFTAKNGRFVALVYRVTNQGAKLVPVASVVDSFRMVAADKAYPITDAMPKCGPISASLVTSPSLPSSLKGNVGTPGRKVMPGETADSLRVYTLPPRSRPDAWFSPRLKLAVDLGQAPTIK